MQEPGEEGPIRYKLKLLHATEGEVAAYQGRFSETDSRMLRGFVAESEILDATEFVRSGMSGPLQFAFVPGEGFKATLPPRAHVVEFMYQLRPFVLTKEPYFFPRTFNVVRKEFADPRITDRFELWREQFFGKVSQSAYTFSVNATVVNSDDTLRLWLNAFEYHRDEDKRLALQAVFDVVPKEACEVFFFDLLVSKAEAVLALAALLRRIHLVPANSGTAPGAAV